MTPKEKAKEVFNNMFNKMPHPNTTNAETYIISKRCAIVAVDEILNIEIFKRGSKVFNRPRFFDQVQYWQQVKKELEKL